MGTLRRFLGLAVTAVTLAVAFAQDVSADPTPCEAWEVEYALAAQLRLADTPLGQGDGVYSIGPGSVVLRYEDRDGQPGGRVAMRAYAMREHFTVVSKTFVFTTRVETDTKTHDTPDPRGIAAEGRLDGTTLSWATPVRGYRTDGTLICDGSMCGKLGAPPPGRSELHIGPGPVSFRSFELARDRKTFSMAETFVAHTDVPRQSAYLRLAGREVTRTCVAR